MTAGIFIETSFQRRMTRLSIKSRQHQVGTRSKVREYLCCLIPADRMGVWQRGKRLSDRLIARIKRVPNQLPSSSRVFPAIVIRLMVSTAERDGGVGGGEVADGTIRDQTGGGWPMIYGRISLIRTALRRAIGSAADGPTGGAAIRLEAAAVRYVRIELPRPASVDGGFIRWANREPFVSGNLTSAAS